MIWEMLLGGGGHIFEVSGVALRPILFSLTILTTIYILVCYQYRLNINYIIYFFIVVILLNYGIFIGVYNNYNRSDIIKEVMPFLYLLLLFIIVNFKRYYDPFKIRYIFIVCGLIISAASFLTMGLLFLGVLRFDAIYSWGLKSGELIFRGKDGIFFFKPVYVVAVSLIILILQKQRNIRENLYTIIFSLSILITFTKGLVVVTGFIIFLFSIYRLRFFTFLIGGGISIAILIFVLAVREGLEGVGGSVNTRGLDFQFITANTTVASLFFGNGFGSEIRGRLMIENSYLWVWWKLGIFPIVILMAFLWAAIQEFYRCRKSDGFLADSFFGGILFVFLISFINPLITNVIGMTIAFLCYVGLKSLPSQDMEKS